MCSSVQLAALFGVPLQGIALRAGALSSRGEAVISARGLEGGGIYAICAAVREGADLTLDLLPNLTVEEVTRRLTRPRGKASLANHLRKALKLTPAQIALMQEFARPRPQDSAELAARIKSLPVRHQGLRPLDEAISTGGGRRHGALDCGLGPDDDPGPF